MQSSDVLLPLAKVAVPYGQSRHVVFPSTGWKVSRAHSVQGSYPVAETVPLRHGPTHRTQLNLLNCIHPQEAAVA